MTGRRAERWQAASVLDKDADDPLYRQLIEVLRGRIQRGEITRRVPSLTSLMQEFDVSRGTARNAQRHLAEAGLIRKSAGRGYFVVRNQDSDTSGPDGETDEDDGT